jgi:hypothetical protein
MTIVLLGVGTTWTSGSRVTVQNSVKGATNIMVGTFTVLSQTLATLSITTGAGLGTWTITIDGVVSPPLAVGSRKRRYPYESRPRRP